MKKEKLLQIKRDVVAEKTAYKSAPFLRIEGSELRQFSIAQLETMCEIINRTLDKANDCNPFVSLSATEVMQKSSGKIASFEEDGSIREELGEEVMRGASSEIYKKAIAGREKA